MQLLKKYGGYFLVLGVLLDFFTPYYVGFKDQGYNQLTEVISLLGDVNSPVRENFNRLTIIAGMLMLASLPRIYAIFSRKTKKGAWLVVAMIGAYGLFDCIFSGLFSVDTSTAGTVAAVLHNGGSAVGYTGFLLLSGVLTIIYSKYGSQKNKNLFGFLFILCMLAAGLYGLARIPQLQQVKPFNYLGLWQRVSSFCNYLPMLALCLQTKTNDKFD